MSKILFWYFGWQFFGREKSWQHFLVWQKNIWESLHQTKCHWQPFNIQQQVDCPLFLSIFYLHLQNSSLSRLADLSIHNSSSSPAPNKSPGTRVSLFHKLFLALSATLLVFDTINHRDRLRKIEITIWLPTIQLAGNDSLISMTKGDLRLSSSTIVET